MTLFKATVDWFHASQPFGVAKTIGDLKSFGIHMRQLCGFSMGPEGHPVLDKSVTVTRRPELGAEIYLLDLGRKNQRSQAIVDLWGFADDLDQLVYEHGVETGKPKQEMPFKIAAKLLAESDFSYLRDRAFGDEEFGWSLNAHDVANGGYSRRGGYRVWFTESRYYLPTSFSGDEAERLYDAGGKTRNIAYNDEGAPREW